MPAEFQAGCIKGHTQSVSREEMVTMFGLDLVKEIESGAHHSVPLLPLSEYYGFRTATESSEDEPLPTEPEMLHIATGGPA